MRNVLTRKYNIADTESVMAYSHYLVMKGQLIGMTIIDGHEPKSEELELQRKMSRTCDKIVNLLSKCEARYIADLTSCYTTLSMIGLHKLPDPTFINGQRDKLFHCWKSGDKMIDESSVYRMLTHSNPSTNIPESQRQALTDLREHWLRSLKKYNTFSDTTTYERYSRLSLIMRDNVDIYFNGDSIEVKKAWYEKNKIVDIKTAGSKILVSYRRFVNSLCSVGMTFEEVRTLDIVLLNELITRKDLNEFDRTAYQFALEFETRHDA